MTLTLPQQPDPAARVALARRTRDAYFGRSMHVAGLYRAAENVALGDAGYTAVDLYVTDTATRPAWGGQLSNSPGSGRNQPARTIEVTLPRTLPGEDLSGAALGVCNGGVVRLSRGDSLVVPAASVGLGGGVAGAVAVLSVSAIRNALDGVWHADAAGGGA